MTMVSNAFGASETPATLNDKMKNAGGFQGANIIPAVLPTVVPQVHFNRFQSSASGNLPTPLNDIDATLSNNKPVIVEVDYSPAPGLQSHWVVLLGKSGNDYVIQDPWPYPYDSKQVLLSSRFGFAGGPQAIIKGALWIDSESPQPKLVPNTIPTSGFAVYPTVDGLALRQQPYIAENNLIIRLALQETLYVNEDTGAALAKVGIQGQWIQVTETNHGYQGYVSAWYLTTNTQPAPTPSPDPVSPPPVPPSPSQPSAALIVYALGDGLALRTQPVVSSDTLLKREPLNAQFLVLDDNVQALAKLGVANQWLQVRDIVGSQGYVAAWFVSTNPQLPLGIAPSPSPALQLNPQLLAVRSTQDSLALRSQTVISDATLLKRYPLPSDFLVIEPVGPALAKIGQNNQWIKVAAIDGVQGYVAAWYVAQCPLPAQI